MKKMKKMKQLSAVLLAAVLMLTGSACGKSEASDALVNQVVEVTAAELAQNTGIELNAPKAAEDVSYGYIAASGSENAIAQVTFTLDHVEYCYRAQSTGLTSLTGDQSVDAVPSTDTALEAGKQLSGLDASFKNGATTVIGDRDAFCTWTNKKSGFVVWLDPVPGILYTLSTSKGATEDALCETAEAVFEPAQGES